MNDEERETRYLAVDGANFDELIEQTQALLTESPEDKQHLLTRWLSLRVGMTQVAAVPGSTQDSQAQITALLKTIESLQGTAERMQTEHVDWHGPDGALHHPDWCRECRIDKIMYGVRCALEELERHIDQPGTPPEVSNVCRRVARLLTEYKGWHAPVEWETAGLREVRSLVERYVKLDDIGQRFPWVSTIEGLNVLLGDVRSMHKTIERRGRWLAEAKRRLAETGRPVVNDDLNGTGTRLERGAVLAVERDGVTTLYTITDVRETGILSFSVDLEPID